MNPAVSRKLDQREREGLGRHVEDEHALDVVARLLDNDTNANNGSAPKDAPVTTTRRSSTGSHVGA